MPAGETRLEFQIVVDIEARHQVELLEHQAQPVAPQRRAAGIVEFADLGAVEDDAAAVGAVEACDQMQQRALAGTGFA